ncbi:unnamed protein product [Rhizophagus irregularis]|nr:unnamed protein product [Rhizophagus irregularis]CAB5303341.1 unnamed protein product [Rhizophagus irregularis]
MLVSIDEEKYSLVLEYADCGTLGKYLRDDTMTFNWENQLRLQVRFYGYMESVHGNLIFWELTSRSSPFNYETRNYHTSPMLDILSG